MKKLLSALRRSHRPDIDALSAYLDARLPAPAAARLEAHIASCQACRTELDELRQVRAALAGLPEAVAPRSFRLERSQIEPVVRRRQAAFLYAAPALSFAAAIALVVLVGVDLSGGRGSSPASPAPGNFAFNRAPAPGSEPTFSKDAPSAGAIANSGAPAPASPLATPEAAMLQNETNPAVPAPSTAAASPPATAADASALKATLPADSPTAVSASEARSAPPTAAPDTSRQQREGSGGAGTDWLRIGEIIAGCVAVVAAGTTVGMLKLRRKAS